MRPIVSVIIPCYGVERFLNDIYYDLSKQSFSNVEYIFVNDGGSKYLSEIINAFAVQDSRIVVIEKENGGVSSARNKGIDVAKGDWVMFVDPDDRLDKDYIRKMIESVSSSTSVIGIGGFTQLYTQTNKTIDCSLDIDGTDIPLSTAYDYFPAYNVPWNKIIKTKFLKDNNLKFPEEITYLEDEIFCLQVYNLIDKCCLVRDCGYKYMMRQTDSALSKYHCNLKQNMSTASLLKKQLLNKLGKNKEYLEKLDIEGVGLAIYILIINLFKKNTTYNFKNAYSYIRDEVLDDNRLMELFNKHNWKNDKLVVKVSNILISIGNPFLIVLFFKVVFWVKKCTF